MNKDQLLAIHKLLTEIEAAETNQALFLLGSNVALVGTDGEVVASIALNGTGEHSVVIGQ